MSYESLKSLIRQFEGLRLQSYLCPAGKWTIGYGSTGKDVAEGMVWTLEQAETRMEADAEQAVKSVQRLCPGLAGNRLEAVADFVYNLGSSRLEGSTLRKLINSGDFLAAAEEFEKWVLAGKVRLDGLVKRRKAEKELFLK